MKLNEDILTKDAEIRTLKDQAIPAVQGEQPVSQAPAKQEGDLISYRDMGMLCEEIKDACNQRRNFEESKGLFNSFV